MINFLEDFGSEHSEACSGVSGTISIFKTYHPVKTFNHTSVLMLKMRHSLNSMTSSGKVKSLIESRTMPSLNEDIIKY